MHYGGYNSIKPEAIHASGANRDKALQLIRWAFKQAEETSNIDFPVREDLVAHMIAIAEVSLTGAPDKQTFAIQEEENENNCYLLLAQQLHGRVTTDLYFPTPTDSLHMIKAFTGHDSEISRSE